MKFKFFAYLFLGMLVSFSSRAELAIDVSGAMRDPMPIAIPSIIHDGFFIGQQGDKILKVVEADLERSGLFRIIDKDSYIQEFSSMEQEPEFLDWKAIKAQALLQSEIEEINSNTIKVSCRVWDVYAEIRWKDNPLRRLKIIGVELRM